MANIKTSYICPPIPSRNFDWQAWDADTYDGASDSITRNQLGHGATEQEAITDLMELRATMPPLTIPEILDAANNEIQAAKKEICSPVDSRLIDALEMLHSAITHHIFNAGTPKSSMPYNGYIGDDKTA